MRLSHQHNQHVLLQHQSAKARRMRVIFLVFEDFWPPKRVQSWPSCVAQLLSYRRGEHDPAPQLAGLPQQLRRMILHMIQLDPGAQLASPKP